MQGKRIITAVILIVFVALMLSGSGCSGISSGASTVTPSGPVKPKPVIANYVATTSGTAAAYYTTLDIKVKNEGAEGTVLVQASVTQAGVTNSREQEVYLGSGETHELKLTFPLVWKGGDFGSNVQAVLP
jgi:hypothetical protein